MIFRSDDLSDQINMCLQDRFKKSIFKVRKLYEKFLWGRNEADYFLNLENLKKNFE